MTHCPVCRLRIKDELTCLRCNTDLKILHSVQSQAKLYMESALYHILKGNIGIALKMASKSRFIYRTNLNTLLVKYCEMRV